jgi:hypothetical protein
VFWWCKHHHSVPSFWLRVAATLSAGLLLPFIIFTWSTSRKWKAGRRKGAVMFFFCHWHSHVEYVPCWVPCYIHCSQGFCILDIILCYHSNNEQQFESASDMRDYYSYIAGFKLVAINSTKKNVISLFSRRTNFSWCYATIIFLTVQCIIIVSIHRNCAPQLSDTNFCFKKFINYVNKYVKSQKCICWGMPKHL